METFETLYDWWFSLENRECWFNSTEEKDELILNKFEHLFKSNVSLDILDKDFEEIKKLAIGYILANDQVVRHWVRHKNIETGTKEEILKNHYKIIEKFIHKLYFIHKDNLIDYDFCFTVLPLRHTQDYWKIKYVLKETWEKLETNKSNPVSRSIYTKFLTATYQRANFKIVFEKRYLLGNITGFDLINMHQDIEYYVNKFSPVLDEKSFYSYTDLYKKYDYNSCEITRACQDISREKKLIVSISGGVDSMVVSWILKKLGYTIVLLHINYSNRENTDLEQELVETWGKYLNVRIFYRKLDEINRPKCMDYDMRNIYESYTRDQRYQSYIQTSKIMGWDDYGVILGHNHDDCIENVFTNIVSKTKWENLYGMEFSSDIRFRDTKINFIRPLLNITKSQIYEFALKNNILFLWDSTPKWSQRGKIRDLVRPSLYEFNPNIIDGLNELVKVLKQSTECIDELVRIFSQKIKNNKDTQNETYKYIEIDIEELTEKKIFWEKFLEFNNIKASSKSIDGFIEKIKLIKKKFIMVEYNYKIKYQVNKSKQIVFYKNKEDKIVIIL